MPFKHLTFLTSLSLSLLLPIVAFSQDNAPAGQPPPQAISNEDSPLNGTVVETMNAAGYTYLLLEKNQEQTWVAIPETTITTGQQVRCAPGMLMQNFSSKTLNRTFARIYFSPGLSGEQRQAAAPQVQATPSPPPKNTSGTFAEALQAEEQGEGQTTTPSPAALGTSTGSAGAIVPSADIHIAKATGDNALTVGECFDKGKAFTGKTVRVQAQVMKVSTMIMGKNWVHLQDGTGNPMKNHHDLVVTTKEEPQKGQVVLMEGTLQTNRDFGAGYSYEVLLEDAKIISAQ